MKNMSNSRRYNIIWSIMIIGLLILLLLISCGKYGKIETLTPTGNIDIFDIIINCNCEKCKTCPTCKVCQTCKDDEENKPTEPEEPIEEVEGLVDVFDEVDMFENQTELKIFENYAFVMPNKIAPGSTNMYQFIVRNENDVNIKYSILMSEENEYNINMKYRLKKNGKYIIGNDNNWVSYSDLKVDDNALNISANDIYSLDWKWFDSRNDTHAGINAIDAVYQLNIGIKAESVSV